MKEFVTSDWHFDHRNIFGVDGFVPTRKHFKSKEEMNDTIIDAINSVSTSEDILYHPGDIGFGKPEALFGLLERINPRIVFVGGNHDNTKLKKYIIKNNYETPHGLRYEYHDIGFKKKRSGKVYIFSHYPLCLGNKRVNIRNICGHIHELEARDWNVINVGIDSPEIPKDIPFGQPIELEKVYEMVEKKWEKNMKDTLTEEEWIRYGGSE